MSRWIFRLAGILVVVAVTAWFLNGWLNPDIPDYMNRGLDVQTQGQETQRPTSQGNAITEGPPLSLTSLEEQPVAQQKGLFDSATTVEQNNLSANPTLPESKVMAQENDLPPLVLSNPNSSITNTWLQTGAFLARANADNRAAVLQAQGWHVDIEPAKVDGKTYYRVYVGPLVPDQVPAYLKKLEAMNISARETNR